MKFRKTLAGVLAATFVANTIATFPLSKAHAESVTAWAGHERKDETFDTWDNTFDLSWLSETTGTADDPYIIDSAEDWAGLVFAATFDPNASYDDVNTIFGNADIDTSVSIADTVVTPPPSSTGENRSITSLSTGYNGVLTAEETALFFANKTKGASVTATVRHIDTIKCASDKYLYFMDTDGSVYYVPCEAGITTRGLDYDLIITTLVDPDFETTEVSYKIVDNYNQTTVETASLAPSSHFFTNAHNIYDAVFLSDVEDENIVFQLTSTTCTYMGCGVNHDVTSETEKLSMPIAFRPEMFTGKELFSGNEVASIPSSCVYIGAGAADTVDKLQTELEFKNVVSPEVASLLAGVDLTFADKAFKVTENIDFSNGLSASTLAATIDFDNHIFIAPDNTAMIHTLTGVKNAVLLANKQTELMTNLGTAENCEFLRKNCFFNSFSDSNSPTNLPVLINTAGTLKDVKYYSSLTETSLLANGVTTITGADMLVINGTPFTTNTCVVVGFASNVTDVSDFHLTSDSDVINTEANAEKLFYAPFSYISNTISDSSFADFGVYCYTGSKVVADSCKTATNVEIYTDFLNENSSHHSILPCQVLAEDVTIDCDIKGRVGNIIAYYSSNTTTQRNCNIHCVIEGWCIPASLVNEFDNSVMDITYTGEGGTLTSVTYGSQPISDSVIRVRPAEGNNNSITFGSPCMFQGFIERSYIDIGKVKNSAISVIEKNHYAVDSYFKLETIGTGTYGLGIYGKNSYFDIDIEGDGTTDPRIGEVCSYENSVENCYVHINLHGTFRDSLNEGHDDFYHFGDNGYNGENRDVWFKDSVYLLTIDDNATGHIVTGINCYDNIENSLILIDEFPDTCYSLEPPLRSAGNSTDFSLVNSSVVIPKFNYVYGDDDKVFGLIGHIYQTPHQEYILHDSQIYINAYPYNDNANCAPAAVLFPSVCGNNPCNFYNMSVQANFYDKQGNDLDIPVSFMHNVYQTDLNLQDIYFKTNSPEAMLFSGEETTYKRYLGKTDPNITTGNIAMSDIFLDFPNGSTKADTKSGLMGSIKQIYNNGYTYKTDVGYSAFAMHILADKGYDISNIYIPEGQSVYFQKYLEDDALVDSANIHEHLSDFYVDASLAPATQSAYDYTTDPAWVIRTKPEQMTTAEIAYLLDRGDNADRTTSWTVLDEITFRAPDTGEELFTLPKHLDLTTTPYYEDTMPFADPTKIPQLTTTFSRRSSGLPYWQTSPIQNVDSITGGLEQEPVYKYELTNNGNGTLDGTGFNKQTKTLGNLFAKANVPLLGQASANTGYILKTVEENGTEIPSTGNDPFVYTVSGYTAPAKNAVINAVFLSDAAKITKFSVPNLSDPSNPYEGVIDQGEGTITVIVPDGYSKTNVTPIIEWEGQTLSPDENEAQDFTDTVTYIVTAEAGNFKGYDVNVYTASDLRAEIIKFSLPNPTAPDSPYEGTINQTTGKITVTVPSDYNRDNVVPEIEWIGKTLTPDESEAQNFTSEVDYTVEAFAGNTKDYTVNVIRLLDTNAQIIKFSLPNPTTPANPYEGTINQTTGEITVTVPKDYDRDNVIPEIEWIGETLTPDEHTAQDFTSKVTYTVKAEAGNTKGYNVTVKTSAPTPTPIPPTPTPTPVRPKDDTAEIIRFVINGYEGEIDNGWYDEKGTITLNIPETEDITDVVPVIVWRGEELTPDEDDAQDFTTPLIYTVTAENGREKEYDIVVNLIDTPPVLSDEACIIEFVVNDYEGIIDQDKGTITLNIPENEDITNSVPDIIWKGKEINPDENEAQDFTQPLYYTVTAESGREKTYEIIINILEYDAYIIEYYVNGYKGEVQQNGAGEHGTITLNIPDTEDISNVVPVIVWEGERIVPAEGEAQDFNKPLVYKVYSKSNREKSYDIVVNIIDTSDDNPDTGVGFSGAVLMMALAGVAITARKRNK